MQSTYLGTNNGDGVGALALTSSEIYVAGGTSSPDFPAVAGGAQEGYGGDPSDGFIARLTLELSHSCTPTVTINCCGSGLHDTLEECDDGNQVGGDGCSPHCALEPDLQVDPFLCYGARNLSVAPPIISLNLIDQLGAMNVQPTRTLGLCAPADLDGSDPSAPTHPNHLQRYRVTPLDKKPLAQRLPVRRQIVNRFGTLMVSLTWPQRLLVPSAKGLAALPDPPVAPLLDHFICYAVRRPKGEPRFVPIHDVAVTDQFGTASLTLRQPTRLCLATDKNGEVPSAPQRLTSLLCYRIRRSRVLPGRVFVANQLGRSSIYPLYRDELCVPSRMP